MRPIGRLLIAGAAALAAGAPAAQAAGGGKVKAGPQGIPFECSDGRTLRVVYGREGPKAKAKLLWDGAEPRVLEPAHLLEGLRYSAEVQAGQRVSWTTDGIEGVLWEGSAGDGEREVVRCRRAGWDGGNKEQEAEGSSHHEDGKAH